MRGRRCLRASAPSAASATAIAVAITARARRGLVPATGHGRRLTLVGFRVCRWSLMLDGLNAIADVVGNRFGKPGLKRRRLILPLFFGLLFAPLRTVAHPSAHVALVTRSRGRRQCRGRYRRAKNPHFCDIRPTPPVTRGIYRPLWRMLRFTFRHRAGMAILDLRLFENFLSPERRFRER